LFIIVLIKINNKNSELNRNNKLKNIENIVNFVKCIDQVNFKIAKIKSWASLFFTNNNTIDNKKASVAGIIHINNSFFKRFRK
jgi:hypothetical protein